jgi:hypothetical protein
MLGMLREKMADYVMIYLSQSYCRFSNFEVRHRYLRLLREFGYEDSQIRVYELRPKGPAPQRGR